MPRTSRDEYVENLGATDSGTSDRWQVGSTDVLVMKRASPSQPGAVPLMATTGDGDDIFIDVQILYTLPPG